MSVNSLDKTIDQFFSGRAVTREECDRKAAELAGEAVKPVQIQGSFSYTVAADNILVQFRVPQSLLDPKALALARKVYGNVVPVCVDLGVIGQPPSLHVYVMNNIPGITYIETPMARLSGTTWQEQTVSDFARFFAKSWINRFEEPYRSEYSLFDLQGKLDILSQELPSRFTGSIKRIREELSLIFVPTYPLVLTHTDLCEMNIIVDPDRGGITGVVDWDEVKVLPFGMSLWGLQNMLGSMNSTGWHYHESSSRLQSLFWDTFYKNVGVVSSDEKRAIQIAERAGLLFRYGFRRGDGVSERPVNEQDSSIRYLDALLLGLDDRAWSDSIQVPPSSDHGID